MACGFRSYEYVRLPEATCLDSLELEILPSVLQDSEFTQIVSITIPNSRYTLNPVF